VAAEVELTVVDASASVTDPAVMVTGIKSTVVVVVETPGKFASGPPALSVQVALEFFTVQMAVYWLQQKC
jgi:hypothetical protein